MNAQLRPDFSREEPIQRKLKFWLLLLIAVVGLLAAGYVVLALVVGLPHVMED